MKKNGSLSGKARLNLRLNQWSTKQLATDNLNSKAGRKLIKRYSWLTQKEFRKISNVKSGIEANFFFLGGNSGIEAIGPY